VGSLAVTYATLLARLRFVRVQAASNDNTFSAIDSPQGIDGIEIAVFEGEVVLFDEEASMVHHLAAVAGAVWVCCDGDTTVEEITAELSEIFGSPVTDIEPAVMDALQQFAAEGLLVGHQGPTRFPLTPDPTFADDGTEVLVAPPDP